MISNSDEYSSISSTKVAATKKFDFPRKKSIHNKENDESVSSTLKLESLFAKKPKHVRAQSFEKYLTKSLTKIRDGTTSSMIQTSQIIPTYKTKNSIYKEKDHIKDKIKKYEKTI